MSVPAHRVKVKPPERGVFALDHDGECKGEMKVGFDHYLCLIVLLSIILEFSELLENERSRPFSLQRLIEKLPSLSNG